MCKKISIKNNIIIHFILRGHPNKLTMMQGYIQIIWIRKTYIIDGIPLLIPRFDYVIYKYFYLNVFILIYTFTFIRCYNNQTGPIDLQSLSKTKTLIRVLQTIRSKILSMGVVIVKLDVSKIYDLLIGI